MKWNEWFEGFDLEPLQSDSSELCGNLPMSWEWVSLSKWLEMSDLTKPYQNEWNRWEMNELRWIEWNEWFDGFDFVNPMARSLWSVEGVPMKVTWNNPMGKSLWVENECPYQFDLNVISEKVPMFSWMNVPIKVTWNNPMEKSLWSIESVHMEVTWVKVKINVPIKMNGIDEKWMKWSE